MDLGKKISASVSLPKKVWEALERADKEQGLNRSKFILELLHPALVDMGFLNPPEAQQVRDSALEEEIEMLRCLAEKGFPTREYLAKAWANFEE